MGRNVWDGGYSHAQYNTTNLRALARMVADALPDAMRRHEADTIVVTGKSGHSIAFAALMLIDFPLVVVRKETDQSHGCTIEGPSGHMVNRYLILDDFVATGATIHRVIGAMGVLDTTCVGVLEYAKYEPERPMHYMGMRIPLLSVKHVQSMIQPTQRELMARMQPRSIGNCRLRLVTSTLKR